MHVTINAPDSAVYIDGVAMTCDLTGLSSDVHAVQWYGDLGVGEIEYRYDVLTNSRKPNQRFTDFAPFQPFLDRRLVAVPKATAPSTGVVNVIAS